MALWLFGHTRLIKTRKDVALPRPDKARRVSPGFENWFMYPGVCRVMLLCMEWYDIYVGLCIADNKINHGYISLAANLVKTLKKIAMFLHIATRVSSLHWYTQTSNTAGVLVKIEMPVNHIFQIYRKHIRKFDTNNCASWISHIDHFMST